MEIEGAGNQHLGIVFTALAVRDFTAVWKDNGLGLALVKEILAMEEGEIFVDSGSEGGAKFTVRLKVK